MKYIIKSNEPMTYSLCEEDDTKSIVQNIYSIISTRKGSIPMYREFGLPMAYKDRPLNVIETIVASEIIEALKAFEKRATLLDVSCSVDENNPQRIIITLEVDI